MIDTEGQGKSGEENIHAACSFILDELSRGPFAPALTGDILARFNIQSRLADFVREHLANRVILLAQKERSPVARPALALASRIRDPLYWRAYRLGSLFKVWPDVKIDMSVLDSLGNASNDSVAHDVHAVKPASFKTLFPVGAKVSGEVIRSAQAGNGLIVSITALDGKTRHNSFLPVETLSSSLRCQIEKLIGKSGTFEIVSTIPERQSVLLKMDTASSPVFSESNDGCKLEDMEHLLILSVRSLYKKGRVSDEEYQAKIRELLKRI